MTVRVVVSLLGPLAVHDDAKPVPIAGPKRQALVALLALSAPRSVSDDRIIDELWGDHPPRNPVNALQAQVSQLRRVIWPDAIVRDTFGYGLAAEVDVDEFEVHVREARRAAVDGDRRTAGDRFSSAISLIRGPPLGDLLDHRFAREAASRLEQMVISAHEGYVDAELALGHHAEVLSSLLDLVVAHPFWERFHCQLMIALFRCGRQSDALRAYQHARNVLAEEVGVEPGPELRALEQAVLTHDPSLVAPISLAPSSQRAWLPVRQTSFVGRDDELGALGRATRDARLVTIVGPAGVGKSRLAMELLSEQFSDREVWFIELAAISDSGHVAESVAGAVGAPPASGRPGEVPRSAVRRIIDRFAERPIVVVLDNCEHVRIAAAQLAEELLIGCESLRIVATSREPLGLDREQQFGLGTMSTRDASLLFTTRAQAVRPEFSGDQDEITDLCVHLDRLPLAIELAAARTKTMPVTEIAARLSDRFALLRRDQSSEVERESELRAAIDWSYDMLFETEQRLFRQLAVYAGGATLEDAQALFGPDALDVITRLVDKSLLLADTTGRTARFGMLETLRAYGLDRLNAAGELTQAYVQHCRRCIDLAERAETAIRGVDQVAWLDRLDEEHDNLRAALAYAVDSDPVSGVRLIGALILPWWFRGRGSEARQWVDLLLGAVDEAAPDVLAKALTWSGLLADFGGGAERSGALEHELRLADERQRRAITLSIETGDDLAVAYARSQRSLSLIRAALAGMQVDMTDVTTLIEQALATFERHGDHFGAGTTRTMAAVAALSDGRIEDAAVIAERARHHALHSGDRFVLGRVEWIAGLAADAAGDTAEAYRRIENGLRLLDELGMHGEVTSQALLLATLAERRGEPDLAAQWRRFVAARNGGLTRHDALLVAAAKNAEGLRSRNFGDFAHAREAHLTALTSYREAGAVGAVAFTESCLGFLATATSDSAAAQHHHGAALTYARASGDDESIALAFEGIATLVEDEHADRAACLLGASSRLWSQRPDPTRASHRDDANTTTKRLEGVMGVGAFREAWERGRMMDRSQATALAFSIANMS